jgi:two-component system response regulator VicR
MSAMKPKILIIIEDGEILNIIKIILETHGFEVFASMSLVPVNEVSIIKPVLVVLDFWINGEPGHGYCTQLKTSGTTRGIPIILVSTSINLAREAVLCHADGFIEMPFEVEDFIKKVKEFNGPALN